MDSIEAFFLGEANRGNELMVFDWDKAAQIIKDKGAKEASAGLHSDWEWTGGDILRDGIPIQENETYTYLASTWATPELRIDDKVIDCYRMQSETDGWDSNTYWPESAKIILGFNNEPN